MAGLSKLGAEGVLPLASVVFYGLAGLIWLVMLPLTGFPPHVGLLGVASVLAAYGLFKKSPWAMWLILVLFVVITAFAGITAVSVIGVDVLTGAGMLVYAVLTWVFTFYAVTHRK
ncbi:MAG: hypothetical protein NWF04_06510 [Candidatus Bathyarchaeota archaeon]|nr:hypothetical protein [Candidatus Bathyarchaeota archaeon]